jgi:hypothetical protein
MAAPLAVSYDPVTGATANSRSFWIEQYGHLDAVGSTISYASGKEAAALGFTHAKGAFVSGPGQVVTSASGWLDNLVANYTNQFGSFDPAFAPDQGSAAAFQAWAQSSNGLYAYIPPPSGSKPLTLDANQSYAGSFSEGAGDTSLLSGGHLLLPSAGSARSDWGAGEFGIREASGSARGEWGASASWEGSVGHGPWPWS